MFRLFEKWRNFISEKENPIIQHNFSAIKGSEARRYFTSDDDIENLVKGVPQLSSHKVTQYLGGGVEGPAFLLDNDHVLKVLLDPFEGKSESLKAIKNLMFSGKGSRRDVMVYDVGKVNLYVGEVYYAEMERVIPFEQWIKVQKNEKEYKQFVHFLWRVINEAFKANEKYSIKNLNDIVNWIYNYKKPSQTHDEDAKPDIYKYKSIPNAVKKEIVLTFANQYIKDRDIGDLHTGNLGVILKKGHKPPVFTFFDF